MSHDEEMGEYAKFLLGRPNKYTPKQREQFTKEIGNRIACRKKASELTREDVLNLHLMPEDERFERLRDSGVLKHELCERCDEYRRYESLPELALRLTREVGSDNVYFNCMYVMGAHLGASVSTVQARQAVCYCMENDIAMVQAALLAKVETL